MNIRRRIEKLSLVLPFWPRFFGFNLSLNLANLGSLSNVFHRDELDRGNLRGELNEPWNLALARGPTFSFAVYTAPRPQFKLLDNSSTAARPRNRQGLPRADRLLPQTVRTSRRLPTRFFNPYNRLYRCCRKIKWQCGCRNRKIVVYCLDSR